MTPKGLKWRWIKALCVSGMLSQAGAVAAEGEVYKATLLRPRGIREAQRAELTVTVDQFSTEEELADLRRVLDAKGSDALMEALRRQERGTAKIEGGPALRVNHVRAVPAGTGQRVIIVTDRPLYFPGDDSGPRSEQALGFIQLTLNQEGRGTGTLVDALSLRINEEGVLEIGASRAAPIKLEDVRRVR